MSKPKGEGMPATQFQNREWFYIRADIREISQSAQGINLDNRRLERRRNG
ncbi:hypothetical protein N9099_02070 [Mariniblastus sp.]|nr:hypothetical protein [Mariniblastus sp.]